MGILIAAAVIVAVLVFSVIALMVQNARLQEQLSTPATFGLDEAERASQIVNTEDQARVVMAAAVAIHGASIVIKDELQVYGAGKDARDAASKEAISGDLDVIAGLQRQISDAEADMSSRADRLEELEGVANLFS